MIQEHLEFALEGRAEYIELIRLLKYVGIAENGAHAGELVMHGLVRRNGVLEMRKRAKIRAGDLLSIGEVEVVVRP
ncbi:MAG: RNA-binding S4 domain-containing protein [Bacteroides sp.]